MDEELVERLRCPLTLARLAPASGVDLAMLRREHAGVRIDEALIGADREHAYRVVDGIFLLLPHLALPLTERARAARPALRDEKRDVAAFYDEVGWQHDADKEAFHDAGAFEDLRPVSSEYVSRCHRRLQRYLRPRADTYLLDVASGPVQYDDYLLYSEGYKARVCVDLSITALRIARQKLGDGGRYVLGDITNLPFSDESMGGVISLHTIYHVPRDEQEQAFREVHRVLGRGATAAVVYSWGGRSLGMTLAHAPLYPARLAARALRRLRGRSEQPLYFAPHTATWVQTRAWPFQPEIFVWRSVSTMFMKAYVHRPLLGRALLRGIYWLEETFPRLTGTHGEYPVIVISRASSG